jgi:hypothetical protein
MRHLKDVYPNFGKRIKCIISILFNNDYIILEKSLVRLTGNSRSESYKLCNDIMANHYDLYMEQDDFEWAISELNDGLEWEWDIP